MSHANNTNYVSMADVDQESVYFDRFDICEAYFLLAADWGLYDVLTRLVKMDFRPSPLLAYDGLSENAKMIYDYQDWLLQNNSSKIKSCYICRFSPDEIY